jgi:hypothetical protein
MACSLALGLALGGCADDLDPASLLNTSRALAVRLTVTSDPADPPRTNPGPGDSVEVELLVGDPGEALPRTWAFVACVPLASSFGPPVCKDFDSAFGVFAETTLPTSMPYEPPRFTFTMPDAEALEGVGEVVALGVICSGGEVDFQGTLGYFEALAKGGAEGKPPACKNPALDGEIVIIQVPLRAGEINHAPVIDEIGMNGPPFTYDAPGDAPIFGCAGDPAAPRVRADVDTVALAVKPTEASRETYTVADDGAMASQSYIESLQIAYAATAGEMERTFGYIDPGEDLVDHVEWALPSPSSIPAEGLLVRFYFVMRDGRGGADWATRALCVVP